MAAHSATLQTMLAEAHTLQCREDGKCVQRSMWMRVTADLSCSPCARAHLVSAAVSTVSVVCVVVVFA